MCPGIRLAERTQWRLVAKVLWAFDISEPIDQQTGKTIPLDVNAYEEGISRVPLPFQAVIKPRSQAHIETIKREAKLAMEMLGRWE